MSSGPPATAASPPSVSGAVREDSGDARRLEAYFDRLWSLPRSIMGPGFRESLDILGELMPTERLRFESGRRVNDWTVPLEWRVRQAYFVDPEGIRHADFATHNLHLVGYSEPFRGRLPLDELKKHIFTLPDQPHAIPYVTAYYRRMWGFCMAQADLDGLKDGEYDIVVDTELYPGHLEIGEAVLPGESDEEVLFSSYLCHPSLANNELSGPLVMAFLYDRLRRKPRRRYTYRFVLSAETIGTIAYLSLRGEHLRRHLVAGYVLTCLGDAGAFTYKRSRRGGTLADRAAESVLKHLGTHRTLEFDPGNGSDERQYCSPGYDLPVGSLMRTMYSTYPEYHTSLDDKSLIDFDALAGSVDAYEAIVRAIEGNEIWKNTVALGEPQLGRRGVYPDIGATVELGRNVNATMWIVNLADGQHDVLSIAERSGHSVDRLLSLAEPLKACGLLETIPGAADVRARLRTKERPFFAGVDVESAARFRDPSVLSDYRLLSRIFTDAEIKFCLDRDDPGPHFAARFAAKEAAVKALDASGIGGIDLRAIEVVRVEGEPPRLILPKDHQSLEVSLSLSHVGDTAVAFLLLRSPGFREEHT